MKKILRNSLFSVAIAACLTGCIAGPMIASENKVVDTYLETHNPVHVADVEATASQIYQLAGQWVAEKFTSATEVIEYSDAATNTVIGRGVIAAAGCGDAGHFRPHEMVKTGCYWPADVHFLIKIEGKDQRVRVGISQVVGKAGSTKQMLLDEEVNVRAMLYATKLDGKLYAEEVAEYIESKLKEGDTW